MNPTEIMPKPGDVWQWPCGKLAILNAENIRHGAVFMDYGGSTYRFDLSQGRRRDEPWIVQIANDVFGVPDVQ